MMGNIFCRPEEAHWKLAKACLTTQVFSVERKKLDLVQLK